MHGGPPRRPVTLRPARRGPRSTRVAAAVLGKCHRKPHAPQIGGSFGIGGHVTIPRPDRLLPQRQAGGDDPDTALDSFMDDLIRWFPVVEKSLGEMRGKGTGTRARALAHLFER